MKTIITLLTICIVLINFSTIKAQELVTGELVVWVENNPNNLEIQVQVDLISSLCWDASDNPSYPDLHNLTTEYPGSYMLTDEEEDLNWEGCWSYPHYQHAFGLGKYKVTACSPEGGGEGDCAILDYFIIDYRTSDLPENYGSGDVIVDFDVSTGKFYYTGTQNQFPTNTAIWTLFSWIDSITTELEPLPPENLSWYNFYDSPRLQWNHSSNTEDYVTNYVIYRNVGEGWVPIDTQSAALLYYIDWSIDLSGDPEPDYLYYKVRAKNGNRTSDEFSNTVKVAGPDDFGKESNIQNEFNYELKQNYPNPFNPTTTISFTLKDETYVTLTIFDVLGKKVTTLIDEKLTSGNHYVEFDGSQLNSGIYFYEIKAKNFRDIKKFILAK